MQPQRTSEYMLGSNNVSQYPDLPTPYSAQPFTTQQFDSYPSSSNLPSIREMPDRRDRMMGGHGNSGNMAAPPFPNENLGHFASLTPDVENSSFASRRSSIYDQSHRSQTSYPALGSGQAASMGDFSRCAQPPYEASSRSYSSLYGDVDYTAQPMSGPQQANFGVLGDSSDPRSKRRRGNLPKQVTDILRAWFHEHLDHPYPTEEDKQMFIARTGLTISQVRC